MLQVALTLGDVVPRTANCYVVMHEGEALIVDTGHPGKVGHKLLEHTWAKLGVSPQSASLFITHMHRDHSGQLERALPNECIRYLSLIDADLLDRTGDDMRDRCLRELVNEGLPEKYLQERSVVYPRTDNRVKDELNIIAVDDGDEINVGNLRFRVLATPGHSPGHQSLWLPDRGLLFSGDCVLENVTPHLGFWPEMPQGLEAYFSSLSKLAALPIDCDMPGHGETMDGEHFRQRAQWLRGHHERRLSHIQAVLGSSDGGLSSFEVLKRTSWGIGEETPEKIRNAQIFFAYNMTLIYLDYLIGQGVVAKCRGNGRSRYFLA